MQCHCVRPERRLPFAMFVVSAMPHSDRFVDLNSELLRKLVVEIVTLTHWNIVVYISI